MKYIKKIAIDAVIFISLLWLALLPADATISGTTLKSGPYTCNGSTTNFSAGFAYIEDADLVVQTLTTATGAITTLAITSNYTVTDGTPLADGTFPNGTIVLNTPSSSCITGQTLTISRGVPLTQGQAYPEGGPFPSAATEQAFDRLTIFSQQQQNQINNSITIPTVDTGITTLLPAASQRANQFLAFDGSGNVIVSPSTLVGTVLPIAQGGTGQTTASAAFSGLFESTATTLGDILYGGASGVPTRLAGNTTSTANFLISTGSMSAATAPAWAAPSTLSPAFVGTNFTGTAASLTAGAATTAGTLTGALSANQVLGSLTAVAPTGLTVPSCYVTGSALQWQNGTGFVCTSGYATGGSVVLLKTNAISAAASTTFSNTYLTGYSTYKIIADNLVCNSSVSAIRMTFNSISSGYYGNVLYGYHVTAGAITTGSSYITLDGENGGSAIPTATAGPGGGFEMMINLPPVTTGGGAAATWVGTGVYANATESETFTGSAISSTNAATTSVTFTFPGCSVTGTISLYGVSQ